jgi:hypothetical protein
VCRDDSRILCVSASAQGQRYTSIWSRSKTFHDLLCSASVSREPPGPSSLPAQQIIRAFENARAVTSARAVLISSFVPHRRAIFTRLLADGVIRQPFAGRYYLDRRSLRQTAHLSSVVERARASRRESGTHAYRVTPAGAGVPICGVAAALCGDRR